MNFQIIDNKPFNPETVNRELNVSGMPKVQLLTDRVFNEAEKTFRSSSFTIENGGERISLFDNGKEYISEPFLRGCAEQDSKLSYLIGEDRFLDNQYSINIQLNFYNKNSDDAKILYGYEALEKFNLRINFDLNKSAYTRDEISQFMDGLKNVGKGNFSFFDIAMLSSDKNDLLFPILVPFSVKTSSWDYSVSTETYSNYCIFLVPESLHTQEYAESIEFHNRALHHLAMLQATNENSIHSFFINDINVFIFNESKIVEVTEFNEINISKNFFNENYASYCDEYKDDQNCIQLIVEVEIYPRTILSVDQHKLLKTIGINQVELDLSPMYAYIGTCDWV